MMVSILLEQDSERLVNLLPYLHQLQYSKLVVKYGGNAMIDETLKSQVMQDIVLMQSAGIHPILVHGGGPEINNLMKRMGHESAFVGGLRVTDAATMEVVEMALSVKVNKGIVALLNQQGAKAIGLSGKDANLIVACKMLSDEGDLGYVGAVLAVNTDILNLLTNNGYIPVISSVAIGENGDTFNVNADHAAGAIAAAMHTRNLIILTDVAGLYADFNDKSTLIQQMTVTDARAMLANGTAERGMIPKLEACITAIAGGVESAHLIDGRQPHAILTALMATEQIGTMIR